MTARLAQGQDIESKHLDWQRETLEQRLAVSSLSFFFFFSCHF